MSFELPSYTLTLFDFLLSYNLNGIRVNVQRLSDYMNWRWMNEKLGEKEAVKYSGPGIRRTVVKLDKGFYKNTYPVGEKSLAALCKPKVEGES